MSPVVFVSVVVCCVVVPPGVEVSVFLVVDDFSEQPMVPMAMTNIIKAVLKMRFIV